MAIKPMDYIEGAVATGLREGQILTAHVLPNVWPTIVSLAFLEMGGVLMLLGELGFWGVHRWRARGGRRRVPHAHLL